MFILILYAFLSPFFSSFDLIAFPFFFFGHLIAFPSKVRMDIAKATFFLDHNFKRHLKLMGLIIYMWKNAHNSCVFLFQNQSKLAICTYLYLHLKKHIGVYI